MVIGIIVAMVFATVFILGALSIVRMTKDSIKCPKCGGDMFFIGNVSEGKVYYDEKHFGYPHLYKCSKCGYEKTL